MIITVTLNAAIDKSLAVPNFRLGRRHRTVEQRTMAGGKGVNIARTLKALGQPVIATGFAGGATGTHIVEQLTEESILNDFVRIREESRTNTSVLDPTTGEQTEINERGPLVSAREVELFRDKLLYLARGAAIVVFAGSLPRGVDPDIYAALIRDLERLDVTTVVDTDGEPLRQAVRAEPDVVSPNVLEAEELVGHEFAGEEERSMALGEIVALVLGHGGRVEQLLQVHDARGALVPHGDDHLVARGLRPLEGLAQHPGARPQLGEQVADGLVQDVRASQQRVQVVQRSQRIPHCSPRRRRARARTCGEPRQPGGFLRFRLASVALRRHQGPRVDSQPGPNVSKAGQTRRPRVAILDDLSPLEGARCRHTDGETSDPAKK